MTNYTDLIARLRELSGISEFFEQSADAIEALVKERDELRDQITEVPQIMRELAALRANADRYELMRDMKLYEMQQYRCLPVPMEEAYDWFDAQIDAKIRERYPNAEIGG